MIGKLSLADGAQSHLGDQEASRLTAHVLLLLLKVFRVVKSFKDLHFPLLLQLMMKRHFEELLQPENGNVVGENLRRKNSSSIAVYANLGVVLTARALCGFIRFAFLSRMSSTLSTSD